MHPFWGLIQRELREAERVAREDDERMYIAAKGGPFWGVSLDEAREWLRRKQTANHDPGDEDRSGR